MNGYPFNSMNIFTKMILQSGKNNLIILGQFHNHNCLVMSIQSSLWRCLKSFNKIFILLKMKVRLLIC